MRYRLTSRIILSCTLLAIASACDVDFIAGPNTVKNGELVQYQILVVAAEARSSATVYLTGDVPIGWTLSAAQFQASIGGGSSGDLTVHASDPGVITGLPPVPAGHRRIYLSTGQFSAITGNDKGTALLSFIANGAQGIYTMQFWAGYSAPGGETDQGEPFSLALSVLPPTSPNTILADGFEFGTAAGWSGRRGVDANAVALFPFDGDTADASAFGNHGTAIGDPVFGSDRFGNPAASLLFDGSDDQVIVPHAPSLDLVDAITLAAWVKPAANGNRYIVGKVNLSQGGFLYSLDYLDSTINGRFRDALGNAGQTEGYLPLQPDQWQLMVFTWDGKDMVCYVDGVVEGHLSRTGIGIGIGIGDVEIGSYVDARFRGAMDDVLIMRRALTYREVVQLAQ